MKKATTDARNCNTFRYRKLVFSCLLFFCITGKGLHAQNIYFQFSNSTYSQYLLSDIRKITFTTSDMNLRMADGSLVSLPLNTVSNFNYTGFSGNTGVSDAGVHWTVTTIKWQFLGRLTAGFITAPDGTTDAIVACTDLETVSKEQLLPNHGLVEIKTRSGKTHRMEFWRHGEFPYLHDGKYMMREGIGTYKFDGSDGVGMVEFGFHADRYKGI